MAVPSTFADLSTTPGSNSGLISDSTAVNQIDNHCQSIYALIASIYANSGNGWSAPYLPAANPSYTGTLTGGAGVVNLGSGQFYKDASGNVGVGTSAPGAKMEVSTSSAGATVQALRLSNSAVGVNTKAQLGFTTAGATFYAAINGGYGASSPEMNFVLPSGTPGIFTWVDNATERMRIDSSGNQINTPSNTPPTLTVNGQMNLTPTSDTNMRISYRGSDGTTRVANITLA